MSELRKAIVRIREAYNCQLRVVGLRVVSVILANQNELHRGECYKTHLIF